MINVLVVDELNKGIPVAHFLIAPSAGEAYGERRGDASYNAALLELFLNAFQDAVTAAHREKEPQCKCGNIFMPKVRPLVISCSLCLVWKQKREYMFAGGHDRL